MSSSAITAASSPVPSTRTRAALGYFRLYESLQSLTPALAGLLRGSHSVAALDLRAACYLLAALAQQFFVFLYNDLCDFESDRRNPRKRAVAWRRKDVLRNITGLFFVLSLVCLWSLPSAIRTPMLCLQALGALYSNGWTRLKTRAPFGEAVNFIYGFFYFMAGIMTSNHRPVGSDFLIGAYFGLVYLSGEINNHLMDHDCDRASGLDSLAIGVGKTKTFLAIRYIQIGAIMVLLLSCQKTTERAVALVGLAGYLALMKFRSPESLTQPDLLDFRTDYRRLFGALTVFSILSWIAP